MKPKFVIITPTYPGRIEKLANAVASVKSQTFKGSFTHVVIGDGPTPEAAALCKEQGVIYEEVEKSGNWGYACRNLALDKYEAERYLFLDDDNVLLPSCLKSINAFCEREDPVFLISKILFYDKFDKYWLVLPKGDFPMPGDVDMLNFCIKEDIAKTLRFKKEHKHELDWYYAYGCLDMTGGQFKILDEVVAVYF